MITPARILIGILVIAVVGLGVALLGVVVGDEDNGDNHGMGQSMGFAGMMAAMGDMDSDAMLDHMREVLGEDGFKRMQKHIEDHRSGTAMTGTKEVDDMMHTMMDGMMSEMKMVPRSSGGTQTPAASATTSPGR